MPLPRLPWDGKGGKGWWRTDKTCFFFIPTLSLFSAYMANVTQITMVPAAVGGSDGLTKAVVAVGNDSYTCPGKLQIRRLVRIARHPDAQENRGLSICAARLHLLRRLRHRVGNHLPCIITSRPLHTCLCARGERPWCFHLIRRPTLQFARPLIDLFPLFAVCTLVAETNLFFFCTRTSASASTTCVCHGAAPIAHQASAAR